MAKKPKKKSKPMQLWKLYKGNGDSLSRKNQFCPKCGPGVFLASHKERQTCGKCGYMEKVSAGKL